MPIRFSCPHCGRVIKTDESFAGRKARCPGCQQLIEVPAADTGLPPANPAGPPAANDPDRTVSMAASSETRTMERPGPQLPKRGLPPREAPAAEKTVAERSTIKLQPHPEPAKKSEARTPLKPKPAPPVEVEQPAAATEDAAPRQPRKKSETAVPSNLPRWAQPKRLGIVSVALSSAGFLLFWVPFLGLALCLLGMLAGVAAIGLSLLERGVGFAYGLAGICIGMMGFVPGLVRTRQTMVGELPHPPAVRQAYSDFRGPYRHAAPQISGATAIGARPA
jgi:hypothetical protein